MSQRHAHSLRQRLDGNWLRLAILAAYLTLSVVYAFATPIFEKNDEESHAWFIRQLATGGGLPVQTPGAPGAVLQREASQPPLYYWLAAPVFNLFNTSDFDREQQPNASPLADPYSVNNKNLLIITPEKRAFHYTGTTLAMALIRLLGIVPGALVVWWTYAIAHALTRRQIPSWLAMSITAFNPMFLTVTTSVANDGLVIAFSTAGLLLITQIVLQGVTRKRLILLSVVVALASLTKVSGLMLLPVAATALVGRAWLDGGIPAIRLRKIAYWGALIGLVWALIAGWWYFRNLLLYGDPTGTSVMAQMMTPRSISIWQALSEFTGFRMSYIAIFGQFTIHAHTAVYVVFDALLIASAVGIGIGAIRWVQTRPHNTRQTATLLAGILLGLHILLLLVSIIRWTMMTPASQGRLLFPAISGVSTLMAIGLWQWFKADSRLWRVAASITGAAFLTLAAVSPFIYIIPAYTPPLLSQLPGDITPVTQRMGNLAELVGYSMTPDNVVVGQKVRVSAVLRALSTTPENFLLVVKLYGRNAQLLARFDTYPGNGLLPSSLWQAGDMFRDDVEFTVPSDAQAPAVLSAQFELYNRGAGTLLPSTDASGHTGAPLFKGSTLVPSPTSLVMTPRATAGDIGALVSYTYTQALPGQVMTVTLTWQSIKAAPKDYTVFVHLIDHDGLKASQHDGPPDQGNYNTSHWAERIIFTDAHPLPLPASMPPGRYLLQMGLYDPATNERLPLRDSSGAALPDRTLQLGEVIIY